MWVIETNIDDMTGEMASYAMEKLFEKGALDVFYTPIYMKKNRPALKLTVLCKEAQKDKLQKNILKHTTTIGLRTYKVDRICMNREFVTVKVKGHKIDVKVVNYDNIVKYMPEYEDCKKVAQQMDLPIQNIYQKAIKKMLKLTED